MPYFIRKARPANIFLLIAFVFAGFVLVSYLRGNVSYAAECAPGECDRPGEYECQYGTMCCTCGINGCGCPSWSCINHPGYVFWEPNRCCKFIGGRLQCVPADWIGGTCRYCVGEPEPPPPEPADEFGNFVGRVVYDLNGVYEGAADLWSDTSDPGATCSSYQSDSMAILKDGSDIISGWNCNNDPPEAYYYTSDINLGSDGREVVSLTFIPPPDYSCSSWSAVVCINGCGGGDDESYGASGTCVVDNINMNVSDQGGNHLWFYLEKDNVVPTGTIDIAGTPDREVEIGYDETITFNATGNDADGNLDNVAVYRRPWDYGSGTFSDPFTAIGGHDCGVGEGSTCSFSTSWTPTSANDGWWVVYLNAYDDASELCSGLPGAAFDECDLGDNDYVLVNVSEREMRGYIWNSTGESCGANKSANEIGSGDVDGSFGVDLDGVAGTWDPDSFSGYSYVIKGFTAGAGKTLCTSKPNPSNLPGFSYNLKCLNNGTGGVISGSCAVVDVDENPEVAHLGFDLISKGWFTSKSSDVFADSISVGIPLDVDVLGGFEGYLVEDEGTVFAEGDLTVKNPDNVDKYVYRPPPDTVNEYYVEDLSETIGDSSSWPLVGYDFEIPSSAVPVSSLGVACSNLFDSPPRLSANNAYRADLACIQSAVDGLSDQYRITGAGGGNGVAVIYIEDSGGTLVFGEGNNKFQSANISHRRLAFITEGSVRIHEDLSAADSPTMESDRPLVEAAIIAKGGVTFDSIGDTDGDGLSDDSSVIVEGPLISVGGITFGRDRGLNNGYPAEVVHFDPNYLLNLTDQEYDASDPNYTGLFLTDLKWEVVE